MNPIQLKPRPKKRYSVRYQTITVYFDQPVRRDICDGCGKSKHKGEIKNTQGHHWIYAYKPETVKKNPKLALENRSELCYFCHQIADALRVLCELQPHQLKRVMQIAFLMPPNFQRKFTVISRQYLVGSQKRAKKLLEFDKRG